MATYLEKAIRAQPEAVEQALALALGDAIDRLAGARRIVLAGTGTSFHAAELGAAFLATTGVDATAARAMQLLALGPGLRTGDAVVVLTHTGETAFARAVRARALELGLPVVSITRAGAGWPDAIETVPRERAETYTVSYLVTLVVLARLAAALGATALGDALVAVPAAVAAAVRRPSLEDVPAGARAVVFTGVGPSAVTAREAALKCREAARLLAEAYDAETLLHGHAVPLRAGDVLVLLSAGDDPLGLLDSIGRAAAREGVSVCGFADASGLPPLLAQLPLTVSVQRLALRLASERGVNPDVVIDGAWRDERLWQLGAPQG